MNDTVFDTDAVTEWAKDLTGGKPVEIRTCRPGQEVVVTRSWGGGIWGHGHYQAKSEAVYPDTTWALAAPSRRDYSLGATRASVVHGDMDYFQPPCWKPTLYQVVETGRTVSADPERRHYNYQDETFVLVVPRGENEAEFKARERREFASRQRDTLIEIGASRSTIKAVFNAAGVARAVEGAKLALRVLIAVNGDQQAALNLLAEVDSAPYGRERRLARLAKVGITHNAPTAGRLNGQLRAAVAFAAAHWGLTPQEPAKKKVAARRGVPQPLTHGLTEGWKP